MNQREKQKNESRSRILESASRLFRKFGFAATGVDAVMGAAGLTAGGFYSHFKSKNELLGECLKDSFEKSWEKLSSGLSGSPREKGKQILARYLSVWHRDHEDLGCPLVGIAAELGRYSRLTSKSTSQYLELLIGEFQALGLTRQRAIVEVSTAVGALLLSRLVKGESLSEEILLEVREKGGSF